MGKKRKKDGAAEVVQLLVDATQPVPASLLVPPGVVITRPEDLGTADLLPYQKADRTPAGPLQELETMVGGLLGLDTQALVSREGEVAEHGSALLFEVHDDRGGPAAGWLVASYDSRRPGRIKVSPTRMSEAVARVIYARRLAALT